jgi:alpha-L-fucosidase
MRTPNPTRRAAIGAGLALAGASALPQAPAPALTDEQRSALKQANADPTLAPDLLLPEADLAWWRDAKLGVFVHWGLYAIPARGEWYMYNEKVPAQRYAELARRFDPKHYDPDAWAALAADAGARYMVLTARHHDGFALWDSPASFGRFDARHAAAARRDLVAPFVTAVRRAGLHAGLYYSPMDWRFPGYFKPHELSANAQAMKRQGYGQVEELMSRYGRIDILWYDGGWLAHQGSDADAAWFWEPDRLNRMVRKHQPQVVISPRSGWQGDFDVVEGDRIVTGPIRPRAWEQCFSISRNAWGYTQGDNTLSGDDVIVRLVETVVRGGNLMPNVGPDPDGRIPASQQRTLRELGAWMRKYGEAVQGTRAGPLQPVDGVWGMTQRGDRAYLHVLRWPTEELQLPALPRRVRAARNLSGANVAWRENEGGLAVTVAPQDRGAPVTVIELTLAGG